MPNPAEKFIHAFNLAAGGGWYLLQRIFRHFRNWQYAWEEATAEDFLRAGISKEMVGKILEGRVRFDINNESEKLYENDIFLIGRENKEYPVLLKEIVDAPFLLYRKGAALKPETKYLSMVGTRKISAYGEDMAMQIAQKIAINNCVIVSGLAIGVDSICHFGAVKKGKPTVAILASGVSKVTPATNYFLARKILETGGTLLSEYPTFGESYKGRYLERNRIIAGMSAATIVVEAPEKSGALVTARLALEQNRDVYALAGDIGREQTAGCLRIIEAGEAYPVLSIKGLLNDLGLKNEDAELADLDNQSQKIYEELRKKPATGDELGERLKMGSAAINVLLTKMELKGLIRKNGANKFEASRL